MLPKFDKNSPVNEQNLVEFQLVRLTLHPTFYELSFQDNNSQNSKLPSLVKIKEEQAKKHARYSKKEEKNM